MAPFGMLFVEAIAGYRVAELSHTSVVRELSLGNNIAIYAGGFVEAAGFHDQEETVSLHTYSYWLHIQRRFPTHVLQSILFYGGATRFFKQSTRFRSMRTILVRNNLPGILPIGIKLPSVSVPVYYRIFTHDLTATPETIMVRMTQQIADDNVVGIPPIIVRARL